MAKFETRKKQGAAAGGGVQVNTTDYSPSQETDAAKQELDRITGNRPGKYESPYEDQLEELYDRIMNREDFSWDPSTDALYRSYREQYQNQGRLAMEDTMGRAAGLTGGYGSSYSQSVGQQTYNRYLTEFGSMAQELYRMALDQYNRRGQDMLDRYGMLQDMEKDSYDRYRDSYDWWLEEYYDALDRYQHQQELDYQRYQDSLRYQSSSASSSSSSPSSSSSGGGGKASGGKASSKASGTSSRSGTQSSEEERVDYQAIKALARQYMSKNPNDRLGSAEMRQWMRAHGLTDKSAELFLEALRLMGYGTGGDGIPDGRFMRDDRSNYIN